MKENTLSDKMKAEAIGYGLCQQWQDEWSENSSKDAMCEKFIKGLDFCIKHDFPSIQCMKDDFGDVIHNHGIYCDEHVELMNPDIAVFNGSCDADVMVDIGPSRIYARHGSMLSLKVINGAQVWVNVYDNSKAVIVTDKLSKVYVHNYGDAEILYNGNVMIKTSNDFFKK